VSRNSEIRKILESRERAEQERERIREVQKKRRESGRYVGLDPDNLYCRNSLFPWSGS
jgi:hypothetical protein